MAKKEKNSDKKLTKEEKKLKKEAKKLAKEEEIRKIEINLDRYLKRLTDKQMAMAVRFREECLVKGKKEKQYLKELTDEKEKALIRELIDVANGKIQLKPIGARDLANLWKRQNFSFINRTPGKQSRRREPINRYEPITPGYSDSNKKPENPKPDNQPSYEPDYDEPQQPVKFDERLFDELDKHSDEINKYLDGV